MKYFRCFMIFKSSQLISYFESSALALLLLKSYFQDHVVNIYSQDYSIMIEKEAIFQPRVCKTMITFAHMNKKMFFPDRSRLLSFPEFAVYSWSTGLHRYNTSNGFC